jgi:hypothetical protein
MSTTITRALPLPHLHASTAISMSGLVGCYLGARFCLTFLFSQSDPKFGSMVGVAINILPIAPVAIYSFGTARLAVRDILRNATIRLIFCYLVLVAIRGLANTERFDISFPLRAIAFTSLLLTSGGTRQ